MRLAIIADIHSNLPALTAVLADIARRGITRITCLGDLVGYNTWPSQTLAALRAAGIPSLMGNHDLMCIGQLEPVDCGPNARKAVFWTRDVLSPDETGYLKALPLHLRTEPEAIEVHSCLGDPVVRLDRPERFLAERDNLRRFDGTIRLCFTGHTHVQQVTEIDPTNQVFTHKAPELRLSPGSFYFINPGSVGHPRESDYRAAYASYDRSLATVTMHRVAYDRASMDRENARHGIHTDLGPTVAGYRLSRLRDGISDLLRGGSGARGR